MQILSVNCCCCCCCWFCDDDDDDDDGDGLLFSACSCSFALTLASDLFAKVGNIKYCPNCTKHISQTYTTTILFPSCFPKPPLALFLQSVGCCFSMVLPIGTYPFRFSRLSTTLSSTLFLSLALSLFLQLCLCCHRLSLASMFGCLSLRRKNR